MTSIHNDQIGLPDGSTPSPSSMTPIKLEALGTGLGDGLYDTSHPHHPQLHHHSTTSLLSSTNHHHHLHHHPSSLHHHLNNELIGHHASSTTQHNPHNNNGSTQQQNGLHHPPDSTHLGGREPSPSVGMTGVHSSTGLHGTSSVGRLTVLTGGKYDSVATNNHQTSPSRGEFINNDYKLY